MYAIDVVTAPTALPVTVAELRDWLRLNGTAEDDQLELLLWAAVERFEADTRRPVLETEYRQWCSRWPCSGKVVLGRGGITEVTSVGKLLANDTLAAVTGWRADVRTPPARVILPPGLVAATADDGRPVEPAGCVLFTAGWANAAAVPKAVKVAVRLLAAHWYEHREAFRDGGALTETPAGWEAVTNPYRLMLSGDWGQ